MRIRTSVVLTLALVAAGSWSAARAQDSTSWAATMVRPNLPPILTLHGDADPIVPYQHAVRLHEELTEAGVANQLHTVPGGGHGNFTAEQALEAYRVIRELVSRHVGAPAS